MNSFLQVFFGAPKIPIDSIKTIQTNTPDIIIWAAPVMFVFVLVEWFFARKEKKEPV